MTALLSLLKNIQQQSQLLLECLKQEKHALDNNQLENLDSIANQKLPLLEKLEQLDKQRIANSVKDDFDNYINTSNNPTLISQWQTTRLALSACRQQNEVNGRLIRKRSQINQDILSVLSGRDQTADETYNAQGNQVASASLLSGVKA
jgi:flagellar biosynthesis/type III secretory pathway chaperone